MNRVLQVRLGGRVAGWLVQIRGGGENVFVADEEFGTDPDDPILSLSMYAPGKGVVAPRPTRMRLPPFFSNLLPEGRLRKMLAQSAGIHPENEFDLIALLGRDLPGAVIVTPDSESAASSELSHFVTAATSRLTQNGLPAFSLAGVQMKFSALVNESGGLTLRSEGPGGDWIVKLPSARFPGVPENEHVVMSLARLAGIDAPKTHLVPLDRIDGLPESFSVQNGESTALAVERFDRRRFGGSVERIHIEDFAQVFGVYARNKYGRASYANIGRVLWQHGGPRDIRQFIRRLTFSAWVGDGDSHLKNWSVIYPDGIRPQLAPAYDLICTQHYMGEAETPALSLHGRGSRTFRAFNREGFDRLARKAGIPAHLVLDEAESFLERLDHAWRSFRDGDMDPALRQRLDARLGIIDLDRGPEIPPDAALLSSPGSAIG